MSSERIPSLSKLLVCAVLLLGSWSAALAREPAARAGLRQIRNNKREVPLLYVVPAGTPAGAALTLEISQGQRVLVREKVELPKVLPAESTIDVLVTHPAELKRLRAMEAKTPGSLQFTATIDGRVITDQPFAAMDVAKPFVKPEFAVGVPRQVDVNLDAKPPRVATNLGMVPDPTCADNCWEQYLACYERCDERGDSCAICSREYSDCLYYCPQICEEPKAVYYVDVRTIDAIYLIGYECYTTDFYPGYIGDLYEELEIIFTITRYQRTEHCDGTYTDVYVSSFTGFEDCWELVAEYGCFDPIGWPPGSCY